MCALINETWIFSSNFRKILKNQISLKFILGEHSCSMQTGGQTKTKPIVPFGNSVNAPKTCAISVRF